MAACIDHGKRGRKQDGYSKSVGGRLRHRIVYEDNYGPIPEGLVLHHSCGNPRCVNPEHLVAITQGEHLKLHIVRVPKTECAKCGGSDFRIEADGYRRCRPCHNALKALHSRD